MIIKVIYNKNTKTISITNDYASSLQEDLLIEVNEKTIVDTSDELSFEMGMDTSIFTAEVEQALGFNINGDNN
jgi:hypothetical protein